MMDYFDGNQLIAYALAFVIKARFQYEGYFEHFLNINHEIWRKRWSSLRIEAFEEDYAGFHQNPKL